MFIGNQQIRQYFDGITKNGGLSHAYLFYGPEGIGKKTAVLEICESIAGPLNANPDFRIFDKGGNEIHIADIRELKNFMHLTAFGTCKAVVLNNAHNLGRDASGALLKVLEEPPGKSVVFLISHLPDMISPTILSRCQRIRFKPLKEKDISGYLSFEKKIKKETADSIAKLASGSFGLALELADGFDNFKKNINLLERLAKSDFKERFETAKKISSDPDGLKKIIRDWFIHSASLPGRKMARELLYLNNIISKPQFNHKMFLENFLAGIT